MREREQNSDVVKNISEHQSELFDSGFRMRNPVLKGLSSWWNAPSSNEYLFQERNESLDLNPFEVSQSRILNSLVYTKKSIFPNQDACEVNRFNSRLRMKFGTEGHEFIEESIPQGRDNVRLSITSQQKFNLNTSQSPTEKEKNTLFVSILSQPDPSKPQAQDVVNQSPLVKLSLQDLKFVHASQKELKSSVSFNSKLQESAQNQEIGMNRSQISNLLQHFFFESQLPESELIENNIGIQILCSLIARKTGKSLRTE